ncbi:MAG TPA: hypothetical protein PKM73_13350 [Verrucomicrobiota bacterium]|nr:hypothetical protein [Verrucomicrobiota bacterium]HNU52198.1 hypothetical protein [Verrucomicrobiota bacterium]
MRRTVLVILSNRLDRNQKIRYFEVSCDNEGRILGEKSLRAPPREPRFDEVWENDDGKTSMASCNRFKRKYRHPLERRKT